MSKKSNFNNLNNLMAAEMWLQMEERNAAEAEIHQTIARQTSEQTGLSYIKCLNALKARREAFKTELRNCYVQKYAGKV